MFEPAKFVSRMRLPFEDEDDQEKFEARIAAGRVFHKQLNDMTNEELAARKAALDRADHEASERIHWSNQPSAVANEQTFDHWSKAAYWSIDEAAALLIARKPSVISQKIALKDSSRSDTLASFLALHDLLDRALTAKQINFNYGPGGYLAWAKRNRIDIPAELEEAVRKHGHQIDDWKGISDRQASEIAELKARLAETEAGRVSARSATAEATVGARERDSLLKLVIGMAIKGYAYDPRAARGPGAQEISDDLALIGIPLDSDTVRKYLNEAKSLLPPQAEQDR